MFATIVARFRVVGLVLMPLAIAANAVPIIAFAPIFNVWFNPLEPTSKMAIAAVLCFFPVLVNTLRGLQSVQPSQIELMRSYAASELEIYRRVRVPTALPYVFTALKVASVLAMIGAVVGEYFGGSFEALGVLIRSDAQIFNFERAWAGIAVASLLGIALYLAVAAAERLLVRWTPGEPRCSRHRRSNVQRIPATLESNERGGRMNRRWVKWLVAAGALDGARGRYRSLGGASARTGRLRQRDAAAQVGAAGAVRRLLRGARSWATTRRPAST